jgi:hypothetical protein
MFYTMTQSPNTNPPAPGQTPPGGEPPGQTPPPTPGQTPPAPQQKTPLDQLPADVQDYIKLLRNEAKQNREALDAETKAKQEAEQERLKKQGEYQKLAETHEKRVKELEPIETRYKALSELVNTQIEAIIKDWPAEIKAFDPGKDAPVETRQEWVNKSIPIITKLGQPAPGAPGNAPGPKPAGAAGNKKDVDELRERYRATRGPLF